MDNHSTSNKTVKIPLENPGVVTINENIGSGQDVIYNSTSETDTDKTVNNDDLPPPPKRKRKNNKLNNQASKAVQPSQSLHAKKINTLCNIVKEIQKDVKQLKNGIIQKPADLEGDYNITLPIKKMIDLVSLEKKLKENKDCRKDVVNYIKQVGEEAKTLPGFTRCILRAFFIRKVAVKLSAARQVNEKFCMTKEIPVTKKCILDALKEGRSKLKETSQCLSVLSSCLKRATDWNQKQKKKQKLQLKI
ncbi:uncharacterized protein LOC122850424 [Aphidius gifuensis]|uniref:uncharacterized protein LOC122850424 n=1 Tax=Aphidius gifuensis TaxID=684658 RepID=UPI001CDCAF85|nr:uncharacterized protein LOC122850424 [Aphidius gifuensis]